MHQRHPDKHDRGAPDTSPDDAAERHADAIETCLEGLATRATESQSHELLAQLRESFQQLLVCSAAYRERYRTLLDAVPDAVTVLDDEGRIVDANRAASERFGRSLVAMRQLTLHDLNPDLPDKHARRQFEQRELGDTFIDIVENVAADGHRIPTEVHSKLFMDAGQRRAITVARDVSGQRRMLGDLAISESRYRMLLEAMDKGVLIQAPDGHVASINAAACRILGVTEGEARATSRYDLPGWRFVDAHNRQIKVSELPGMQTLRTGKPVKSTLIGMFVPHLNSYRWVSITSVPQFDDSGQKLLQVVNTFSDVTDLQRQSQMFRTTQHLGNIGCWELDDQNRRLFWTEQMYRIHDVDPSEPVDEQGLMRFVDRADQQDVKQALGAVREHGRHFRMELQLHTASDRRRWVSVHGEPLIRQDRICGVVGTMQNIDERKRLEARLRHQATRNPLTGLPNRNSFLDTVQAAIDNAACDTVSVFYIDLDRFKVLSDMLGHKSGDKLLHAAAERLRGSTVDFGPLGHVGNDEFLLLVCGARDQTDTVAEHIKQAFTGLFHLDDEKLALSVSIGIAHWPHDAANAELLVQRADEAVLEAKRRGRSTWSEYNPSADDSSQSRREIESQLRLAPDNKQLRLVYQPQVDSHSNRLTGAEALLRWQHPQLGNVPPDQFIPLAEASGDIVRIGAWVIEEACAQLATWLNEDVVPGTVAINVSHRQVLSGTLVQQIREAVEHYQVSASLLELEFTERVLIDGSPETLATFQQLRDMGVKLLIDDFGEGFSSLHYLRHLPIDGIKISHTFMQGIPEDATDTVVCEAMVRIARSLDLKVVAEGVETVRQSDFIRAHDIQCAQGYLFSRPLEATDLAAYVGARQNV